MFIERKLTRISIFALIAILVCSLRASAQEHQCQRAQNKDGPKSLQERAAAGDADAQCGLGRQYETAFGVPGDLKLAVQWLQRSAEQGDVLAEVELGVVFSKMQQYGQAIHWYRKAADHGNARAEYNFGLAYANGEAVTKDISQAIAWYRKAAEHGDMIAQSNLAVCYEHGEGVQQDLHRAAEYYSRAASQGFAEAQYGLGFLYANGKGVDKDLYVAASWMQKAAEQGETKAQYNLGSLYVNGEGVPRDLNEGYFWIYISSMRTKEASLKSFAQNTLDQLVAAMKKNDVKQAQQRAKSWMSSHAPADE